MAYSLTNKHLYQASSIKAKKKKIKATERVTGVEKALYSFYSNGEA